MRISSRTGRRGLPTVGAVVAVWASMTPSGGAVAGGDQILVRRVIDFTLDTVDISVGRAPDGLLALRRRTDAGEADNMRSLRAHVRVRNAGVTPAPGETTAVGDYVNTALTRSAIVIRLNEGPYAYGTAWHEVSTAMPNLRSGEARDVELEFRLRGAGWDARKSWDDNVPNYRRVRVEVVLDPADRIPELDEGNNRTGIYCFDAPNARFVSPMLCQAVNQKAVLRIGQRLEQGGDLNWPWSTQARYAVRR